MNNNPSKDSPQMEGIMVLVNNQVNLTEVYHSIKSACLKLSISRSTLERWRKEGTFPLAVVINGQDRFKDSEIDRLVLRQNPRLMQDTQVTKDIASISQGL